MAIKIKTAAKVVPQCYAYTTPGVVKHEGWTKIGFTERDVETRIKEQTNTVGVDHHTWWHMHASYMTEPYGSFTDRDFHAYLKKLGVERESGKEWFKIDPETAKKDFIDFTQNHGKTPGANIPSPLPYKLRSEQQDAVDHALTYFETHHRGEFLWNCKPRFGKTLSAYDLCKEMHAESVLILTNRPAIANSWYSDYETFFGPQSGYAFVSSAESIGSKANVMSYHNYVYNRTSYKGIIEFVSLQDLKGSLYFGGIYDKLKELKDFIWDLLIIDEAHEGVDTYKTDVAFDRIKRKATLHLSGTPFKALAEGKFKDGAIYNWTYADEQRKKRDWDNSDEMENPYENLPKLSLFTYQMSDIVKEKVNKGIELAENDVENYAFDLNEFFKTKESGKFVHEADVDKFLDALTTQEKFPFSTPELRDELKHTFWLLNRVDSAKALEKKLKLHPVFKDYKIILAAGDGRTDDMKETGRSFDRVKRAINEYDKTITLSVGQLTTGVTIPEWTAVLMLSNMKSPSLYMQAAFRAQNPCLFDDGQNTYRKENAYVFDFDPARTLTIFEQFANNLIPETVGDHGTYDQKKNNVEEMLNFFPVYGEDDNGSMIKLDAEKVLTVPRHIHAKEVVSRGFMSNFLFANISGIFSAPKEIIDLISGFQAIEEPKTLKPVDVDENTADDLHLNDAGEVELPEEIVIGTAKDLFGDKVYQDVDEQLAQAVNDIKEEHIQKPKSEKEELGYLQNKFAKPMADTLMNTARNQYGRELKKSTQKQLDRNIRRKTDEVVAHEYGHFKIHDNELKKEKEDKIKTAQDSGASMSEITRIDDEYNSRREKQYEEMINHIHQRMQSEETTKKAAETIVNTVETERYNSQKDDIEGNVRDHLRGFSRTIPAFLMAYGDENTTLQNFDSLVPSDVFWEVTVNPTSGEGVTLDQFRLLRDGGSYQADDGTTKHFEGHLFDEVVFNDAVQEFIKKRKSLANYFDPDQSEDIFAYIPPQKTNQIFTPKKVVVEMTDMLEKENPGCFDDPEATFADLYMKSGMYITEIVKRLYASPKIKALYPDEGERLNHIFEKQVYGCAPTEIIYRICRRYILGFSESIHIEKDNIRLCDTLQYAKEGTMEQKLEELFDLQGQVISYGNTDI